MFESITKFFKKLIKAESQEASSKETAKERLHLVLMQDRANVSADFLEMMKQEIIEVIKKYIDVDENAIDVRLTNKENEDGTNGAPALYANIPIISIKEDKKEEAELAKKAEENTKKQNEEVKEENKEIKKAKQENKAKVEKKEKEDNSKEEKVEEVKEDNVNTTNSEENKKESTENSEELKEENKEADSINQ
mgnify:CR=1 FL=1